MNCPFCGKYFSKKSLAVAHIEKVHADRLEADGLDASQELYLMNHPSLHGKCMCGCDTPTEWNYKTGKPYKVSPDPKCRERIYQMAQARSIKATGHDQHTLLHDMEHQKEMLQHRKISGMYKFKDGNSVGYTGKLELSFLKFCDLMMDLPSYAVQSPPENFEYYDPKTDTTRTYIPDYYLPDYNLIVEIKDGGDKKNGNKAFIEETRYKVALKDAAMKAQNKYNYIRISGTNYGPFLETLYQIVHEQEPDEKKRKALIVITESACLEDMEAADTTYQPETIDPSNTKLIIGYMAGTAIPLYLAITDSMLNAYWYVSNYADQTLTKVLGTNAIFRNGSYQMFKCIADSESVSSAFQLIVSRIESGLTDEWDIMDILTQCGIMFDDKMGNANNNERRSDWIAIEQYFTSTVRTENDYETT